MFIAVQDFNVKGHVFTSKVVSKKGTKAEIKAKVINIHRGLGRSDRAAWEAAKRLGVRIIGA